MIKQYVLNQEEFDNYQKVVNSNPPTQKQLQKFASMIADNLVIKTGWMKGKPWGCHLTSMKAEANPYDDPWPCDDCPAMIICPCEHKPISK